MDLPSPDARLTAVVHYPRLHSPELDEFRREHDPFASSIPEHITLMFPVPSPPHAVARHARAVAGTFPPFDLHIVGLRKTWDHWLYLSMREGRERIIRLHDRLYTGPLAEYRRQDLPFDPHIGIGFFGLGSYDPLDPAPVELDGDAYEQARARAEDLGVDTWRRVDTLTVVVLDPANGSIEDLAEIRLG